MVDKELERRAEYPELNTLHLETFANITINIDNVNPQKKKNGKEEDHQEDCQIPKDKNEESKSTNASKTVEPNAIETIEPSASNKIEPNGRNKTEQIESEQKEISRNQISYILHFKSYLENLPILLLKTPFRRNTAQKIRLAV